MVNAWTNILYILNEIPLWDEDTSMFRALWAVRHPAVCIIWKSCECRVSQLSYAHCVFRTISVSVLGVLLCELYWFVVLRIQQLAGRR